MARWSFLSINKMWHAVRSCSYLLKKDAAIISNARSNTIINLIILCSSLWRFIWLDQHLAETVVQWAVSYATRSLGAISSPFQFLLAPDDLHQQWHLADVEFIIKLLDLL